MLNVNAFFVLLCLELNSRRVDSAETNNFIVWPNDDIRTVTMSTENYGLAVACFQVYYASYGITKYTKCNISHHRMPIYESYLPVCRDSSASIELTRYLGYQADTESTASAVSSVGKHADNRRHTDIVNFAFAESRNVVILACDN